MPRCSPGASARRTRPWRGAGPTLARRRQKDKYRQLSGYSMVLYGGPFLLLASIPAFFYGLGVAGPLVTIALLIAALVGAEFVAPRGDVLKSGMAKRNF